MNESIEDGSEVIRNAADLIYRFLDKQSRVFCISPKKVYFRNMIPVVYTSFVL